MQGMMNGFLEGLIGLTFIVVLVTGLSVWGITSCSKNKHETIYKEVIMDSTLIKENNKLKDDLIKCYEKNN